MMPFLKKNFPIILIIALAFLLRVIALDKVPVSLFGDELDYGYQAYSILKTGKDYLGNSTPIFFKSFSEYRLPFNIYSAVPFVAIFGLNEWGVRLPNAVFGTLAVLGIYLLVGELFRGLEEKRTRVISLLAALFMAISPWHLQFSRQANDATSMLTLVIFGLWFFFKGLENYKMLFLSAALFSLGIYSYSTASLFVPLFGVSLLAFFWKGLLKHGFLKLFWVFLSSVLILSPYISNYFSGLATERFSTVSVTAQKDLVEDITKRRGEAISPLTPVFRNKLTVFVSESVKHYLGAFSTNFLFINGDANLRHSVGGFGMLHWYDLPLIVLGLSIMLGWFISGKRDRRFIPLLMLLLAPIPASLTQSGGSHAARLILMLPGFVFLSSLGLVFVLNNSKTLWAKIGLVVFLGLVISNLSGYFYRYYAEWPRDSWRFWHAGYKETLSFVKGVDAKFERIYFNNTYEPMLVRFLFWYKYDPALFQKQFEDDKHLKGITAGYNGFRVGEKYYFGEIEKPFERLVKEGHLIVASARDEITNPDSLKRDDIELLKTVYSPTGEVLFYILTGRE